jgi:hypothetical protein
MVLPAVSTDAVSGGRRFSYFKQALPALALQQTFIACDSSAGGKN